MEKINVQVERVGYTQKTNAGLDRCVLMTDQGKCNGVMAWIPIADERLTLTGDWTVYRGVKEFKFTAVRPEIPEDSRMLLHYVCERTNGIGPAKEKAIWDTLQNKWPEIKPGDIKKLKPEVIDEFLQQHRDILLHEEQYKTIAYLVSCGCGQKLAELAWDEWKTKTIGIVKNNCFRLSELPNYGFSHIDGMIRESFGIGFDDPRRIRAGLIYSIKQAQSDGSTVVDANILLDKARELLQADSNLIFDMAATMLADKSIVGFQETASLATPKDYENEIIIWNFIS